MEEVESIKVIVEYRVLVSQLSRKSIIELIKRYEDHYTNYPESHIVDFNTFLNFYGNEDLMQDLHPDEQKITDSVCYMIDVFEEILNDLDITIPDKFDEDDFDEDVARARIYGETYYGIEDQFRAIVQRLLNGDDETT